MNREKLISDIKIFDVKINHDSNFRDFNCSDEDLQTVHDIIHKPINLSYDEIIKLPIFCIFEYARKFLFMKDYENALKLSYYLNCKMYIMRCYIDTNDINSILLELEKSNHVYCYYAASVYYHKRNNEINAKKYYKYLLRYPHMKEKIPLDIMSELKNEDNETDHDKFIRYRKLEDELEMVIFNKHLRRIILSYHIF